MASQGSATYGVDLAVQRFIEQPTWGHNIRFVDRVNMLIEAAPPEFRNWATKFFLPHYRPVQVGSLGGKGTTQYQGATFLSILYLLRERAIIWDLRRKVGSIT